MSNHYITSIGTFLSRVKGKSLCLQAGGGKGIYPLELSLHFDSVITVEPDDRNIEVLKKTIIDRENIRVIRAGLWDIPNTGSVVSLRPDQTLTNYIVPGNDFPLITIDSLGLKPDLIWLDIEGSEYKALCGATETLKTCPSVIIEEGTKKGVEANVGSRPGQAAELLINAGYKLIIRHEFDSLYEKTL